MWSSLLLLGFNRDQVLFFSMMSILWTVWSGSNDKNVMGVSRAWINNTRVHSNCCCWSFEKRWCLCDMFPLTKVSSGSALQPLAQEGVKSSQSGRLLCLGWAHDCEGTVWWQGHSCRSPWIFTIPTHNFQPSHRIQFIELESNSKCWI